ncbi:unnamed protein product [Sphagnum tenellum]
MVVVVSSQKSTPAHESGKCSSRKLQQLASRNFENPSKWASSNVNMVIGFAILLCVSLLLVIFSQDSTSTGFAFLAWTRQLVAGNREQQLEHSIRSAARPNTFLTLEDSDAWYCAEYRRVQAAGSSQGRSFADWLQANASDEEVMCAAHRTAMQPLAPGTPRVAFLFMVRGPIPFEPLWAKFFKGNEERYSIYVHAANSNHSYHNNSIFYQRQIPSKPLGRLAASMPEAQRRLLAYALLDNTVPNAWFSLVCETAIPIRSFGFVYSYLMKSELSFVEAFFAWEWWRQGWTTENPQLRDDLMRKGEAWFSVHRRHAGLIAGDFFVFPKFKEHWRLGGISAEIYLPTLLNIIDPLGIANRSTTYVNWTDPETGSHPIMYSRANLTTNLFVTIQNQTRNTDGMYAQTSRYLGWDNEESCVYNGVANSSCWLFARKFSGKPADVDSLLANFTTTLIGSSPSSETAG